MYFNATSTHCFVGERRNLDIEYFSKLLEKVLEVQQNRKKLKKLSEKNTPKKRKRKPKGMYLPNFCLSMYNESCISSP